MKHDEVQVLREQSEQQARQLQAAADAVAKARALTSPRHASALWINVTPKDSRDRGWTLNAAEVTATERMCHRMAVL